MVAQAGLLGLPVELQLQILTHLVGDSEGSPRSCNLLDLTLTCRQLASVAREALCLAPVLQSSKVHLMLCFLFKYPSLATKIKKLTVETKETRESKAYPVHIPHIEPEVLEHCKRHVRTLPIQQWTQDNMIASLRADHFEDHGLLLCLLFTMLPQLDELYLGGSILLNFPLFRDMIPNEQKDPDEPEYLIRPDWAAGPDLSWITTLIGPKLTALELPLDLRRMPASDLWEPLSISQLPQHFPNLRWLSIPHMATTELTKTQCSDVIPANLETLILTDARCNCFQHFACGLLNDATAVFPRLSKISLYRRYPAAPTNETLTKSLADAGIEVVEYIPTCCLRSGDEFYHPWKYTVAEIEALSEGRHAGYEAQWNCSALL